MRFRPLCIDYHARAQEIAALELEVRARRAALRSLPQQPSPRNRITDRTQAHSPRCDDGDGSPNVGGYSPGGREGKENWEEGMAAGNDGGGAGGERSDAAADSESMFMLVGSGEVAVGIDGAETETSVERIQAIMTMLGPAVHPSECAFRSIAPVAEGPIRGRKLPVKKAANPLEEWTKSEVDYAETRRNAAVAALESGRSRFDPHGAEGSFLLSNDCIQSGGVMLDASKDTTFVDTMAIVMARHDGTDRSGGFGIDTDDLDADKENELKSLIWSQHAASLPMPTSLYLKHEPEDLATIDRLKSARSAAIDTSFASELAQSFRPQLRALESQRNHPGIATRKGLALVVSAGDVSSKPKIDLLAHCIAEPKMQPDYALRLNTVPFTQFLDDRHDGDSDEGNGEGQQSFRPLAFGDTARFAIRVDPDFDPDAAPTKKKCKPLHELLKPLDEMCSARTISARLGLPSRFEASHELTEGRTRAFLPRTKHQFDFIRDALKGFEESRAEEESSDVLLELLSSSSTLNAAMSMPRKITLDTDIDLPSLLPEEEVTQPTASVTSKSVGSLILELPSFTGMLSFSGKRRGSTASGSARRFVVSSARISSTDALKHVASSSNAVCLFLPQIKARDGSEDALAERKTHQLTQRESASRALAAAIRTCVPSKGRPRDLELLQSHCPSYPVAPWFDSDTLGNVVSRPPDFEESVLHPKRKAFCNNARKVKGPENSRCLLLTGCSSRRNVAYKYSYRGLLTNEVVEPCVFKLRYNSMIAMNKLCGRPGNEESGRREEQSFAQMVFGTFAESITRRKGTKSKTTSSHSSGSARDAPCSGLLTTQRHGLLKIGKVKTEALPKSDLNFLSGTKIDELASSFTDSQANANDATNCGLGAAGGLVEAFGRKSLKSRAELLHLVTKARELEAEKQSYLAELAVVNRGRVDSPRHTPFDGPGGPQFDRGESISLTASDEKKASRKRKAPSDAELDAAELAFDEHKERRTKKRKKDKKKKDRKKAKRKKHRKRKHRDSILDDDDAEPSISSKKRKVVEATPRERTQPASSNPKPALIAKPLLPVGMTPIVPPKKLEVPREGDNGQHVKDAPESRADVPAGNSKQPPVGNAFGAAGKSSGARDKSPESVADLHPLPERESGKCPTQEKANNGSTESLDSTAKGIRSHDGNGASLPQPMGSNAPSLRSCERPTHYEDELSALDTSTYAPSKEAGDSRTRPDAPLTLLTSESFLETYGETVLELASGRWQKALPDFESHIADGMSNGVVVCDTPLLDIAGADIELADNSAIVVQCLSSWSDANQNGGSAMSMQQGARAFLRRLVSLAASGRYEAIHVILCLDVEISSALPGEINNLQNAVIQGDCPCEHVTLEYVARRALAASIAVKSASVSTPRESSKVAEFISSDEDSIQERARFLLKLLPSCSLHMALRCLGYSSEDRIPDSGEALQSLFELAKNTRVDLFPYKMEGVLSSLCAQQLHDIVNVDVSHAY